VSQANVELYRHSIDAWTRGDREAWLSDVPPDYEYHASGVFPGLDSVYRGREGASKLWDDMRGPWENFVITVERIEDLGDTVVALVTFSVNGRGGISTNRPRAHVVTFRDGVSTRTDNYESWDEALKAVGREE